MYNTYLYAIANEGVDSENTYPYKGKVKNSHLLNYCIQVQSFFFQQYSCTFSRDNAAAQMSGSVFIKQGSESDLLAAVASVGPVSVAVDGRNKAFRVCPT